MQPQIQDKLSEIEEQEQIRLLIAIESGSRAWGFPSPDSDYDVRIIYARDTSAYLTVLDRKDTLDFPINDELDVNGWDVRKALALTGRANATPMEWLQSPITYREEPGAKELLWQAVTHCFCPRSIAHHYLGLTTGSLHKIRGQGEAQKLKTWFYVLRPLFAAEWVIARSAPPPMEFGPLREMTNDDELDRIINDLLEQKKDASESFTLPPVPGLLELIEERMIRARQGAEALSTTARDSEELDRIFREILSCTP